ncbi:MAG: DMT family transporter [Planctomycetota bacterium]|nr:MAG: DMT family transporter [Planctomycetota bacterium]
MGCGGPSFALVYLTLLIFSVTAYGLNNVLIGHMARSHDLLWVVTARGVFLGMIMLPLLLVADRQALQGDILLSVLPFLALACVAALGANLCQTFAVRHLPMAIAVAIGQALAALATLLLELSVGNGMPHMAELLAVSGVVAGVVILGWISGRDQPRVASAKPLWGVAAAAGFAICMASALVPLGVVSRSADPFFAAWGWEAGIGLCGLLALSLRQWHRPRPIMPPRIMLKVGLCASPTVIGTGAYTYATTLGSITVAGGVLSAMMVATAIFARILFREMLRPSQWMAIAATCTCLVLLGLAQRWWG